MCPQRQSPGSGATAEGQRMGGERERLREARQSPPETARAQLQPPAGKTVHLWLQEFVAWVWDLKCLQ